MFLSNRSKYRKVGRMNTLGGSTTLEGPGGKATSWRQNGERRRGRRNSCRGRARHGFHKRWVDVSVVIVILIPCFACFAEKNRQPHSYIKQEPCIVLWVFRPKLFSGLDQRILKMLSNFWPSSEVCERELTDVQEIGVKTSILDPVK